MWSRSGRGKCVERSIEKLRHIGFGLSATLLMALPALGCTGFAAAAAADSVCASALQKIFVNLDAHGAEWRSAARSPFRWALPNPVRRAGRRAAAATKNADLVYVFDRLKVGSGCIILKFTPSGYVPLPLDENFAFVAGAMRPFGRPIAACPVPQPKTFSTTNYTTAKPSRAAYGASVNSQKGDAA
jgi:hypothetical protein